MPKLQLDQCTVGQLKTSKRLKSVLNPICGGNSSEKAQDNAVDGALQAVLEAIFRASFGDNFGAKSATSVNKPWISCG